MICHVKTYNSFHVLYIQFLLSRQAGAYNKRKDKTKDRRGLHLKYKLMEAIFIRDLMYSRENSSTEKPIGASELM